MLTLKLKPYTTKRPWSGRRGEPGLPAGTQLWLVMDQCFNICRWAYLDRDFAKEIVASGKFADEQTWPFNSVALAAIEQGGVLHTSRTDWS